MTTDLSEAVERLADVAAAHRRVSNAHSERIVHYVQDNRDFILHTEDLERATAALRVLATPRSNPPDVADRLLAAVLRYAEAAAELESDPGSYGALAGSEYHFDELEAAILSYVFETPSIRERILGIS